MRAMLKRLPVPGLADSVETYLEQLLTSGDISKPFIVQGRPPIRFIMPISFFCESRRLPPDPNAPWFRYIGTAVHQRFLSPVA